MRHLKRVSGLALAAVLLAGGTAHGEEAAHRLGDFVWLDANRDGIQDPGENGVPGVTAVLRNSAGLPAGKPLVTDADGRYLFDGLVASKYTVCFDLSTAPPRYQGAQWTVPRMGRNHTKDSDVDASGCTVPTLPSAGKLGNQALDAGILAPLNKIGDFVWLDSSGDGVQDTSEPGVAGVSVTLQDGAGKALRPPVVTNALGKYGFDGLSDGSYRLCFAKPGAQWTLAGTGPDPSADSDVDASGCTRVVVLGASNRSDSTVDAGLT
jgi:SdrD B-like protein